MCYFETCNEFDSAWFCSFKMIFVGGAKTSEKKLQMKKNIDIIFQYHHECDLVVSKEPC